MRHPGAKLKLGHFRPPPQWSSQLLVSGAMPGRGRPHCLVCPMLLQTQAAQPRPSCVARMTWLEGPDPAPREGAAVWEEGAWENCLWMQIWASIPLRTKASPPKPATALLWALPGRQITFEGFGTGPTSYAQRAVLKPSSVASSAPCWLPPLELPAVYLQPWPTLVTPHPAASRLSLHPLGATLHQRSLSLCS